MAKQSSIEADIPTDEYTCDEREGAVLICEVLADNREAFPHDDADAAIAAAVEFDATAVSIELALAASRTVPSIDKDTDAPLSAADIWGEAAAQIRDLWSPGDSIGEEPDDGDADEDIRDTHDFESMLDEAEATDHPIGFAGDAPADDEQEQPEPCAGIEADAAGGGGGGDSIEDMATGPSDEVADVPLELDDHDHRWHDDGGR